MSGVSRAIGAVASIVALIPSPIQPIAAAVAVVANVAAQLTAKKPVNDRQGSQLSFTIQPGGALPYVMGRTAVGGSIVYRDTYGADNKYQSFVAVLSAGGPIAGYDDFLADKASVPFSGSAATGFYSSFMWQTRQLGATPEASALASGVGTMPNWSSSSKLSGLAASAWTLQFDSKSNHYQSGEPSPLWVIRGVKVYDPRLDSTYPGGSGSCRWADPSDRAAHAAARATWVYSDTPALHGLKWRLGVWERDEGNSSAEYQKIMGIGAPIDLIDLPAIVAAANVQEANGWTIGGQIDSSQDKWEVLKLIEETGGCEPIAVGAMMSTLVKTPRTPRRTITAADLADGKLSAPAMRRRSDRINGYRASFRSEAHGWVITPIDIIQVPDYVTEDGREKTGSGTYSLCQSANQAAELAAYEVFDSRELEPIILPLKPLAAGDRLGDCLTIDIPELGLEAVDAVVRGKQTDPQTGIVTLTLRSETAAKHAAALGLTGETPATPTLTAPAEEVATPDDDSWELFPELVAGTSVATPGLRITGAVENITADAVLFEYRKTAGSDWISAGVEAPDTISKEILGVDPLTEYEAAVRYRVRGVLSDRLVIGPVTTASTLIAGVDAEAVLASIAAAQALAAGKTQYWIQPSPPSFAESGVNDVWISTTEGNLAYVRVAGDGRLAIGGNRLTLGGNYLVVPAWKPSADQRIAAALLAAAGAQATADGKVATFNQTTEPTAEGVGDFWYNPDTGLLKRWSGSAWESTADATALNQHQISQVSDVHVVATSGETQDGQLPQTRYIAHLVGTADVTADAAIVASAGSGVSITVNNTPGDDERGLITIPDQDVPSEAVVTGVSSFGGVDMPFTFRVLRDDAPPPMGGGSGGGGGAAGSPASVNSFASPGTSTTKVELARCPAVTTGSGGTVTVACPLTYYEATEGAFGDTGPGDQAEGTAMSAQLEYSTDGGGHWTAVGTATSGGLAKHWFRNTTPKGPHDDGGSVNPGATITGLGSGTSVIVRVMGGVVTGSGSNELIAVEGTMTATPS